MALRLRRSPFMSEYFKGQLGEEQELTALLDGFGKKTAPKKKSVKEKMIKIANPAYRIETKRSGHPLL